MAKLTLTDIAAGYALIATFNDNNALIEAALENTLSRDGTTPNTMSAPLDMNSQQITNLPVASADGNAVRKDYVDDLVAAITAASGTFSAAEAIDFTNQIDFTHASGIRIMNGTDEVQFSHDGTDFNIDGTATADINITGITKIDMTAAQTQLWASNLLAFDSVAQDNWVTVSHSITAGSIATAGADEVPLQLTPGTDKQVQVLATLGLAEVAAARADVAAFGQIWVKDDAPNVLYYTNDAGEDEAISSQDGSFTPTWVGFSADPAALVRYSIKGNLVTVMIDVATAVGTSDATGFQLTNVPAAIQPATTQHAFIAGGVDGGSNIDGLAVEIQASAAAWILTATAARTAWTASSTKGFAEAEAYTFSYFLSDPS